MILVGTPREERLAGFYRDHREKLKTRLVIRQQSYLKPFREAWEAAEKKAQQEKQKAPAAPAPAPQDAQARLAFEILDVDRGQQLLDEPPYTRDAGDWTVCTCRALAGSRPAFYFAERSGEPTEGAPFTWGEARLWVPSAGDGAELAEAIGDAFRVTNGRSRAAGKAPARPLSFGTVVLGRSTAPRPDGSFGGDGSWTASKWSYEEAIELYVNWSLDEKKGSFAEKDQDQRPGGLRRLPRARGLSCDALPALQRVPAERLRRADEGGGAAAERAAHRARGEPPPARRPRRRLGGRGSARAVPRGLSLRSGPGARLGPHPRLARPRRPGDA